MMESNLPKGWIEIKLHEVVAQTDYPIGDGDHGQIKRRINCKNWGNNR